MAGARESIVVDTPPSVLYEVIVDYEQYPAFLDDVKAAEVLERGDGYARARFELDLIKTVDYTIRLTEEPDRKVTWTLIDSNLMKSNDGGWVLEDLGDGRTRATYEIEVGVGRWVPQRIVNALTGRTLPATLEAFKQRAESRA